MIKLDDNNIRQAALNRFISYKDTRVFEEFTTPSGSARADIVLVNGHIHCFEIKSDFDDLTRLANQIIEYDNVFEKNSIITTKKHLNAVLELLPDYWGIILAEPKCSFNNVTLKFLRYSKINPNIDFTNCIGLIDSNTIKKTINDLNFNILINKYKTEVWETFKYKLIDECDKSLSNKNKKILIKKIKEELKAL